MISRPERRIKNLYPTVFHLLVLNPQSFPLSVEGIPLVIQTGALASFK